MSDTCPFVDVRPLNSFLKANIAGALHLPLSELKQRTAELPPRDVPFVILMDNAQSSELTTTLQWLQQRNEWSIVSILSFSEGVAANKWCVRQGPQPLTRLWQPSPALSLWISDIEDKLGGTGVALDAGCGVGRDATFLAVRGWWVCGIERRTVLLQKSKQLLERYAPNGVYQPMNAFLDAAVPFRSSVFNLVVIVRFIPSLPVLRALVESLAPGGYLVWSQFSQRSGDNEMTETALFEDHWKTQVYSEQLRVVASYRSTLADMRTLANILAVREGASKEERQLPTCSR